MGHVARSLLLSLTFCIEARVGTAVSLCLLHSEVTVSFCQIISTEYSP